MHLKNLPALHPNQSHKKTMLASKAVHHRPAAAAVAVAKKTQMKNQTQTLTQTQALTPNLTQALIQAQAHLLLAPAQAVHPHHRPQVRASLLTQALAQVPIV